MKYTYLTCVRAHFFIIARMAAFNNSDSEPDDNLNINDYESGLRNVQTQASEGDTSYFTQTKQARSIIDLLYG